MYTATHLQVYYSNLFDFCSCTQTICSDIAVVIPFLNVPQCTLSYLIHSQIYFRGVLHDLKKKKQPRRRREKKVKTSVIVEDLSKSGRDLFNGAQYACLSTRSQLIFSSSWLRVLGVWILTLS